MVTPKLAQVFFEKLESFSSFLLVSHPRPDGDTLGAACAIATYLRGKNKKVAQFCKTPANATFWYLPSINYLTADPSAFASSPDVVCVCDAGDLRYAAIDDLLAAGDSKPYLINVDHHATNENFGDLNIVFPEASSTVEVVYELFRVANRPITKQIATCLLTGLFTDTGNFTNAATTASAFQATAELIRAGAPMAVIRDALNKSQSLAALRLWGTALERMHRTDDGKMLVTWLTASDILESNATPEDVEGITRILHFSTDIVCAVILTETEEGTIKGSLRTTKHDVDVTRLAKLFSGGGHKKAAGFTTSGPLTEKRLHEIIEVLKNQLC